VILLQAKEKIMSEISTAEDAIKKASGFLSDYYYFHRLESVKKTGNNWIVEYDVSVLGPKEIVTIKLDSKDGSVLEYTKSGK
jgi:hypothetical protein